MGLRQADATGGLPAHLTESALPADLLRAILDGLPAMVGYWDRDLHNRMANSAYMEWFGCRPETMGGMHIRDLLGPELFERNYPYMARALEGERQTFDRTLIDAEGVTRHTQASYIPDVVDGEAQGFFVLVTEITDRVEAEREAADAAERYRALIRSMPGGFVLLFDSQLRFTVADGEALQVFGYTRESLEGHTLAEAMPPALVTELEPRYARALAGQATTWDRVIGHRVFSLTAAPVQGAEGHVTGGVVVCTDVTEERRGATIAQAVTALAKVAAEASPLEAVAARITGILHEIFGLDDVGLLRFDGSHTAEVLAASPPSRKLGDTIDIDDGTAVALVLGTGHPALLRYDERSAGVARRLYDMGLRVGGAAPIRVRGEMWGALVLASGDETAMDDALLDRLSSVSELVGLAIGNAQAWEALRRDATTDAVTGLPNHRAYREELARCVAQGARDGRTVGLILVDLDHFKAINDSHGHPAGDAVLREVGHRLATVARANELAARIGGEEFALVLMGVDQETAVAAAERARRAIAEEPFLNIGQVTASAGVGVLSDPGKDGAADRLVAATDQALYVAKRTGRNRVVGPGGSHATS
ncbi:MAG: diguanylate cyclase [Solirubrobacteraceae bacterium]|nr:diguanylate cyclase [Solirubrobacteraceae bacterium]